MLDDRYYMRRDSFDARRSATVILLIANVVAFLLQQSLYRFFPHFHTNYYLALSQDGLEQGYVWQLVSYMFMHDGILHLLFNCWAIYVFGKEVEEAIGRRAFLALYFGSGIIGGLVQTMTGYIFPNTSFAAQVLGASAAAFGVAAAFATLFPERLILLFFIIPVRAKYLLWLSVGLAVLGLVTPEGNAGSAHIAHAAHLGGIVAGFVFIRYAVHWHWHWPNFRFRRPGRLRRVSIMKSPPETSLRKKRTPSELPPEEFLSQEVDPILDKISAHGIQSLTERERRILEAARERMAKR